MVGPPKKGHHTITARRDSSAPELRAKKMFMDAFQEGFPWVFLRPCKPLSNLGKAGTVGDRRRAHFRP